jgi:hypothetical protein
LTVHVFLKTDEAPPHGTPRSEVAISSLDEKVLALASKYILTEQEC